MNPTERLHKAKPAVTEKAHFAACFHSAIKHVLSTKNSRNRRSSQLLTSYLQKTNLSLAQTHATDKKCTYCGRILGIIESTEFSLNVFNEFSEFSGKNICH